MMLSREDVQRQQVLEELCRLAQAQREYMLRDEMDNCLQCLQQRERLMERFDRIGPRPARAEPDEARAMLLSLLVRLQELDRANRDLAEEKLNEYRGHVRSVRRERQRLGTYAAVPPQGSGVYFDEKK